MLRKPQHSMALYSRQTSERQVSRYFAQLPDSRYLRGSLQRQRPDHNLVRGHYDMSLLSLLFLLAQLCRSYCPNAGSPITSYYRATYQCLINANLPLDITPSTHTPLLNLTSNELRQLEGQSHPQSSPQPRYLPQGHPVVHDQVIAYWSP